MFEEIPESKLERLLWEVELPRFKPVREAYRLLTSRNRDEAIAFHETVITICAPGVERCRVRLFLDGFDGVYL
jgi:hypothetical protein